MTAEYVRNRITELRLQKGVSEYKMSYDLGHSRGYINNISSGKALPSLAEFFFICEYFEISVIEFFDSEREYSKVEKDLPEDLSKLEEADLELVRNLVHRLEKKDK